MRVTTPLPVPRRGLSPVQGPSTGTLPLRFGQKQPISLDEARAFKDIFLETVFRKPNSNIMGLYTVLKDIFLKTVFGRKSHPNIMALYNSKYEISAFGICLPHQIGETQAPGQVRYPAQLAITTRTATGQKLVIHKIKQAFPQAKQIDSIKRASRRDTVFLVVNYKDKDYTIAIDHPIP
jgi:hypothetical protein